MSIFAYSDYKLYLRQWIKAQPKSGRGLMRKMAEHMRISSTMLSHIFNGDKHLSVESANELADFVGLSETEFEYFLLLVLYARAGTAKLRTRLLAKIKSEQKEAQKVAKRIQPDTELSEVAKATFYSSWLYSGIRNLSACPGFENIDAIARHLHMPRAAVAKIVEFLLSNKLCLLEGGHLAPGPQQTHVSESSPFVNQHHKNWRVLGLSNMLNGESDDLFFTAPMSLAESTAGVVRARLLDLIAEVREQVRPSPSETARCLNIDWFRY